MSRPLHEDDILMKIYFIFRTPGRIETLLPIQEARKWTQSNKSMFNWCILRLKPHLLISSTFPILWIFNTFVISRENDKENVSRHQQMKESISMGQIQATGNYPDAVPAKMLGGLNNGNKGNTTLKLALNMILSNTNHYDT